VDFSGPGTYVIAIGIAGNGTALSDQLTVTVNDTYEAWAVRHGAGLPEEDDECDGLTNLIEYALDSDPATSQRHPLNPLPIGGGFDFAYVRYLRKIDLGYSGQISADLGSWSAAPDFIQTQPDIDIELHRLPVQALEGHKYWRLRVEKP
jgi:hypothetical protein